MTDDAVDRTVDDLERRLARLPWTRFHARIRLALYVIWVLAGLAVGAVAAIGAPPVHASWIGGAGALYLAGEAAGVVAGGALARRSGRRLPLWLAVVVFVAANAAPVLVGDSFAYGVARLAAGLAAGALYAVVLGVVRELLPGPRRTPVLLTVNALYWLGVALGTAAQLALAQPGAAPGMPGWQTGLLVGPALAVLLAGTCGLLPESPAWLVRKGRAARAAAIVDVAVRDARAAGHQVANRPPAADPDDLPRPEPGVFGTFAAMLRADRAATVRAVALIAAQGLVFGGVLFTLVPQLAAVYGIGPDAAPAYLGCFALASLGGALTLGRLLDPGRHGPPYAIAYIWAGGLLALTGVLMATEIVSAWVVTLLLCAAFVILAPVSGALIADATARYPGRLRSPAARVLYALGALGAAPGPLLFGLPLPGGSPIVVALGYVGAAIILALTGLIAASLRTPAVRRFGDTPYGDDRVTRKPRRPEEPPDDPPDTGAWSFPPPPSRNAP